MKTKKRFISLFVTVSILLSLFSINNVVFSESPGNGQRIPPNITPVYIFISQTSASLKRGEGIQLTASINESDPSAYVSWESNNEAVATVSDEGFVLGCSPGTAVITARYNGEPGLLAVTSASCEVTVSSTPVFENGIYFLKNKQTGRHVDIKGPTMASGTTIHQWQFHGGDSQQWVLNYLGDGYYSIKSNNSSSSYYLGVKNDSTGLDVDIVLRTGTITNGMKWKIEQTKNGAFKIIPKTGEVNDYVLATSTSNTTNGAKLIQGDYIDNDSYRDEWYVRPVEHVVAIGGQYFDGQDAIDAAERWLNAGFSSTYNINPTINTLNQNTLNSEIVYFSTHGGPHYITLLNNILLQDMWHEDDQNREFALISDFSLTKAKLYIYDACETASYTFPANENICTATIDAGAECVIGWVPSICSNDAYNWQGRFQDKLIEGMSVKAAANYANTFTDYNNETIKSWRIYGNEDLIVNQYTTTSTATASTNIDGTLKYTSIQYPTHNINTLKSLLASQYADFSLNNANVTITYTNNEQTDYVIDYYYLQNGYTTESGYSLIVNNGVITHIRDNTIQNRSNSATASARYSAPSITPEIVEAAYAQGREKVYQMGSDYSVVEQSAEKYYDILEDKYYYKIFTVYQVTGGGRGAITTLYEIL